MRPSHVLTKNVPKAVEARWSATLRAFDEGLLARGMSEGTRRAYGADLGQLAESAGLRAAELVGLDLTAVDPDREELRVEGKGGKTRIVPAGEPAWRALDAYLARSRPVLAAGDRAETALFVSRSGRRLSTS